MAQTAPTGEHAVVLNWIGYTFDNFDGYGRYGARMIQALRSAGVEVRYYLTEQAKAPDWMRDEWGFDPAHLTISCLPPYYALPVDGPHWLLSMTEGSQWPQGWDRAIYRSKAQRVITPSEYNAVAVRAACPDVPVHVVHGGTDPDEFPLRNGERAAANEPYTFLALADRGSRKGYAEVYDAFFDTFGRHVDTPDVRLIIKARPVRNPTLSLICGDADALIGTDVRFSEQEANLALAQQIRPRVQVYEHVEVWREDVDSPRQIFEQCDVFVAPSYAEGWGMPHREAAMMGLPVIVQRYAGLDDGHTEQWALPLAEGRLEPIPSHAPHLQGEWMRPNVDSLAETMRWCYDNREEAAQRGAQAAQWLRANQTWDHAAQNLIALINAKVPIWP